MKCLRADAPPSTLGVRDFLRVFTCPVLDIIEHGSDSFREKKEYVYSPIEDSFSVGFHPEYVA